jgi:hypothetical protein
MLGRPIARERILRCHFSDDQLHPFGGWVWPRGHQTVRMDLPGITHRIKVTGLQVIGGDFDRFVLLGFEMAYSLDQRPHELQRGISPE